MNKNGFGQKLSQFEFLALQKGKHHGFNAAYKLYADHVYSLAMYIVKNKQTALDVMQIVFEVLLSNLIKQLENFTGVKNFVIFPMFFLSSALYPLWKMQEASICFFCFVSSTLLQRV